ncbi:hypothetical protein HELRODRAFT_174255 [Helobdella robusta]|uniref:Endonuclease/exonuclease/phosphatase domain-containing protein n=1 Tax=Helobdella robusta TaxID=6412 RepID=T1F7W4_HELRO|nr:hypothetical protein HELRODRAFT_174255 [Helobdella robusta]ESO02831.1 hypothetical protein HELRODRAFT_174255 [Helobdella robusta]
MVLSIRQKRVRRIPGDPVHGVAVQGPVDGLATGTPLYSVAVQGTMDGRITCRPRGWRFGTWNVGTLTGRSLEVVEKLQRDQMEGEGTRFVGAKGGRKEEEKDRFYDDFSDEIGQAGLDEFVVLLGDLNGHVGADADGYEGVHGGWGYGIRNEEGRRVLELADAHSMVVGNKRKQARLITERSGEHRSMIDYILIRAKHRKYVRNVKAIPGEYDKRRAEAFSGFVVSISEPIRLKIKISVKEQSRHAKRKIELKEDWTCKLQENVKKNAYLMT